MGNEKQVLMEGIERFLQDKEDVVMGINSYPLPHPREYNVYFSKIRTGQQPKTIGHGASSDLVDALRSAYQSAVVTYDLLRKK